jgi:hypothetical protein
MSRRLLPLSLLVLLGARAPDVDHGSTAGMSRWIADEHRRVAEASRWRSPTEPERAALARAVTRLARGAARCDDALLDGVAPDLAKAGMIASRHRAGEATFVVVEEAAPHGAGLLALRCGDALPLLVQAPHAFFDVHTDDLVRDGFLEGGARAAMWSTVHRYQALPGERPEDPVHPADVTRQTTSAFHTATLALAAAIPELRVLQLHGFGGAPGAFDAVVSSGRADLPPRFARAPLAGVLGVPAARIGLYGDDAHELGATGNVQGHVLSTLTPPRFLHVELSRPLRDRLRGDPALAGRLVRTLGAGAWTF